MQLPEALRLFDKIADAAKFETVRLESRISLSGRREAERDHSVSVEPWIGTGRFTGDDLDRLLAQARSAGATVTLDGGTVVMA